MTDLRPLGALVLLLACGTRAEPLALDPDPEVRPGQGAGCPLGLGPAMARTPEGFCIDTTEVTQAQYAAWLETEPSTADQPASCAGNDDFVPGCRWDPGRYENQPVVCVDWCDARAFCEAAGKRLCGAIGSGGSYAFESYADPAVSEWQAACTSGGANEYTYGDAQDTAVCRGADAEVAADWGFVDVGTLEGCHSPDGSYAAIVDLSGNAAEWDNSCLSDDPDAGCRIRGGSFQHNGHGLRCAMGERLAWPRLRQAVAVGFRCCAD